MITPEERLERKGGLYSSDIARIMCGYSVSVALDKLGVADYSEELDDLAEIRIGKQVEPFILDAYDKQFGCKVERSLTQIMHPEIPWMGVHLDARRPGRNVEAKSAGVYNIHLWGKPGSDDVPPYVLWQAHVGMACTNAMVADIAVCFITLEATRNIILGEPPPIFMYHVERDYVLEAAMIKKATMVRECIERGETPPPENSAEVKLIYARAAAKSIDADAPTIAAHRKLLALNADMKALGEDVERQKFIIQTYMKEAAELRDPNGALLVTWKNDADGLWFNRDKFEEEQQAMFNRYLEPKSGSRRFLPKEVKKKR